jgi:hypothetical protein
MNIDDWWNGTWQGKIEVLEEKSALMASLFTYKT